MRHQIKNLKLKEKYIAPSLTTQQIQMEEGIAAGSAIVNPNSVDSGWDSNEDQSVTIPWD